MTKKCKKCGKLLPIEDFYRSKDHRGGHKNVCKECTQLQTVMRRTGLTEIEYRSLFEQQRGVCAICGKSEYSRDTIGNIKQLSVDHDHVTGEIRGLLCNNCNRGLGFFQDNIDYLKSAIAFLTKETYGIESEGASKEE